MKGLEFIPSVENLSAAYHKLQGHKKISVREMVTFCEWTRFDARLGEQLVRWIFKNWKKISAIECNEEIQKSVWPAAMGVIFEQVKLGFSKGDDQKKLFNHWCSIAMFAISKARDEQFFIGSFGLGSSRMFQEASHRTKPYVLWGYLGKDVLWNKSKKNVRTSMPQHVRMEILKELVQTKNKFTVNDYMEKLNHLIHVRQAQRDIANLSNIKASGNTRSKTYRLK